MGATPAVLGVTLAIGAISALTLTLISSVRRRRHDLALLKALGFTRRQLAGTVAWQSTIAIGIGIVVGVPLGIVAGATLVLANVIAALPGRQAARTPAALVLQSE
jgi:ABC-type lipoprotein release transport system permease subunit